GWPGRPTPMTGVRLRLATGALAALLLLAVGGCGDEDPGTAGRTTPTPESTSTPPTSTRTNPPTTPPSGPAQKVRVTGEVVRTGDCVVVRDSNGITWTVQGAGAEKLTEGESVLVVGAPDLTATGCEGSLVRATRITSLLQK
ncbi:MAG: hypothetical protein ACI379_11435, partial [Nocardioides sp.]